MAAIAEWCHERRFTSGLNWDVFSDSLALPLPKLLAQKIKLNDPQKLWQWRHNCDGIPWAVYLAILDRFGTPKFHVPPKLVLRRAPARLPLCFEKYLYIDELAKPKEPEPPKVEPVVEAPAPAPIVQTVQAPIPQQGEHHTVTIRLEIVVPQGEPPKVDLKPLLERLEELENRIALMHANSAPAHHHHQHDLSRNAKKEIKLVARSDPKLARQLAHQLAHNHR